MDQQKCCGQNNINGGGEYLRLNFLYVQLPTSFEEVGGVVHFVSKFISFKTFLEH